MGFLCFSVMFFYGSTKSVVFTEENESLGQENLKLRANYISREKEKYKFVVLVNAAHGGANKGNVVNELREKDITLKIGKKLEALSTEGKIGIFMIRQADVEVSNESRAQMIESVKPDVVIDLHLNADAGNERTFGTTVLYNDSFYRPDITNAHLADIMERTLVSEIEGKALGIFGDDAGKYPLLNMISVPAVSVEVGYLTNKQEAKLLKSEKYQDKIALGILKGIQKARDEIRKSGNRGF